MRESKPDLPEMPSNAASRVRARILIAMLAVTMTATAGLALADRNGSSKVVTSAECPGGLGDCSGTPETTAPATSSSTSPTVTTTTVAAPSGVLRATSGTLRVDVTLDPAELLTGQVLRMRVKATDAPGSYFAGGSDYGDGRGGSKPRPPILECLPPDQRVPATAPSEQIWDLEHSYRLPGVYKLRIHVASSRCGPQDGSANAPEVIATVEGAVNVGRGLELANGPLVPLIDLVQRTNFDDRRLALVNIGTKDPDGWIETVELDWGDDTARHLITRPRSGCVDPLKRWPGPTEVIEAPTHRYPRTGSYTARLTVTSVACDGSNPQTVTQTLEVNAP